VTDTRWLDDREAAAWQAVRDLGQPLFTALGRDLQRDSGLSMADYQVLVVLSATPDGVLAYRDLAGQTGWEKSRLSHHLTRMERRDLVCREECTADGRSADIVLTANGRAAIESAAPGHVASVRHFLIDHLSDGEIDTLVAVGKRTRALLAEMDGGSPCDGTDAAAAAAPARQPCAAKRP
jgi:DNA-binding MarR family transcriptional regulator